MKKIIHLLAAPMHALADPIHARFFRNDRTEAEIKKTRHAVRLSLGTAFMFVGSFVMTTAEHWHLHPTLHIAVESAAGLLHGFGSIPFCSFIAKMMELE